MSEAGESWDSLIQQMAMDVRDLETLIAELKQPSEIELIMRESLQAFPDHQDPAAISLLESANAVRAMRDTAIADLEGRLLKIEQLRSSFRVMSYTGPGTRGTSFVS